VADDLSSRLAASRAKLERQKAEAAAAAAPHTSNGEATIDVVETVAVVEQSLSEEKPRSRRAKSTLAKAVDVHRTPPHSVESELAVLSSVMLDGQYQHSFTVLADVASKITPEYFYVPAHKAIYTSFLHMWRNDISIELISFTEFLRDHKLLDTVGGAAYVTQLITFVPTAANVHYYTEIMIDKMRRREAIAVGTRIVRQAFASMDDDEFIGGLQRSTNQLLTLSSANGKFPQMIDAADFCSREEIKLPPLVIHYMLHQGSKMLLGGNSKGRKTWALMDLATSVACGADWWGFHTRQGCVCYVNLELQQQFFQQRMQTIWEKRSLFPERGSLLVWNLRGHAKPMNMLINDLLIFLQQHRFTLIIIDPVYKTLPATHGAENDSAIITQLLNDVEAIAVQTGAAVLFSSHFSKGDQSEKESVDRVSGSGAWARDPDSVVTMTPHEDADCFTVDATLRNLAPIRPLVVKWDYPLFTRQDESDPDKLRRPKGKGRPAEHSADEILAQMKDRAWKTGALQKHCAKEEGIPYGSFYRFWQVLRKENKVVETEEGEWRRAELAEEPF
jgi:RecA-family ATPase